MSHASPLPEDHDTLIGQGAHLARWLIGEILRFLAPEQARSLTPRYLRWVARHYLVPAEAVLRRAVYLIAETLTLPAPRAAAPGRAPPPRLTRSADAPARRPAAPRFRLTETPARPYTNYLPVNQRPLISVPGITPRPAAHPARVRRSPEAEAAHLEAQLRGRLAAFEAAWADPEKAALRLLRRRAARPAKPPTLVFDPAPGSQSEPITDAAARILDALNTAVARLADTS